MLMHACAESEEPLACKVTELGPGGEVRGEARVANPRGGAVFNADFTL
jgi:hypothetical protein